MNRRKFFKLMGGGLVVTFLLEDLSAWAEPSDSAIGGAENELGAWIHIAENNTVKVYTGKVEVGQNIRTLLSQLVAEELKIPISNVELVMADTDLVPYDFGTVGSRSTPQMGTQLRKAAATARKALLEMAATHWKLDPGSLQIDRGTISDSTGQRKISYGELTRGKEILMSVKDDIDFIKPEDWKVAGKTAAKVGGIKFLTGQHEYVSDKILPQMQYAKVLRPPSFGAKLIEADLTEAKKIDGVTALKENDFIALVSSVPGDAEKALALVKARWSEQPQPSRAELFDHLKKTARKSDSVQERERSLKLNLKDCAVTHSAEYRVDYIAHVPLEPRAALAEWNGSRMTVWTGTQRPFGVRQQLAEALNLDEKQIRVVVPDTGSGYGGKHSGEAACEAAKLARVVGKPVKLVWTREEEFTWAYFRPAGLIEVQAGMSDGGKLSVWAFENYNSGGSGLDSPYQIPTKWQEHYPSQSPLKQGSYRGLASTANIFARESHMGDLAAIAGIDQLEFRLNHLEDERLKEVLRSAANKFGWTQRKSISGHGYGIACGHEKGGYVATCAEVVVQEDSSVKVIRLVEAFECGAIVNPHHLENQVLGAIVQGIGGAMFEAIDFNSGKINNPTLSAYRVPRFKDVPQIEVILLNRMDFPSAGAGEAPIVGVAPAIRNAILDASGIRLTTLPLLPDGRLPQET